MKKAEEPEKSSSRDYRLLFPAVLAFYVIMTFNYADLKEGFLIAWIKLLAGALALFYLIWINVARLVKKEKGD
ncbi:MAG: hypothetical protein ACPF9D_08490 [Owenweeksia sp.]